MFIKNLLIAIMLFAAILCAQDPTNLSGRKAPNFKLEDLEGNVVDLKELNGKVVLLSFWATWCKPCVEEMGEYQKIYDEFKDKGFTLLAIATDDQKSVNKVKPLVRSKKFTFPVLIDSNSDAARKYYAQSIPYTVLINAKGEVIYNHLGYKKGDEKKLREKLITLLEPTVKPKNGDKK